MTSKTRPVGRPTKGDGAQSKIVSVRFTAADHAALESLAASNGENVSEMVRALALAVLK